MASERPVPTIDHPNRDKASSKVTRVIIVVLMLASIVLLGIVTIGGWNALTAAKGVQIAYALIYLVMAIYVGRWNRGVLPVAAAFAIILLIFAGVSVPKWYDRDKAGFTNPDLSSATLGLVTAIIIPVQALLIAFSMRGFAQAWNVEVERYSDSDEPAAPPPSRGSTQAAPA